MKTPKNEIISKNNSVKIIEFLPTAVVIVTKIKETTSNVTITPFESGEELIEKKSMFKTRVQIIEGKTEIVIDGEPIVLETGQSITIPAHKLGTIKPKVHVKMIQTIIKAP